MVSRVLVVGLTLASLVACKGAPDPAPAVEPTSTAAATISPGQAALTEVWQAANPGVAPPSPSEMAAAFNPTFAKIANAPNDADDALIRSTLTFVKAVRVASPTLCAEAPLARFTPANLAALPAEALPAFRAMLTDRLALIAEGATHTAPPEELMSGSMQTFSTALGDGLAADILPRIRAAVPYDPVAGCTATIQAWEALDTSPQSPQLVRMGYALGPFALDLD